MFDVFSGNNSLNPDAFVWNGNGNRTWEEMTDHLFENKQNFGQSFTFWLADEIKQIRQHMWPFSTCVELDNYPKAFGTSSGKDVLRLSSFQYLLFLCYLENVLKVLTFHTRCYVPL